MRIISGSAAARIIKVPKGLDVRPTPDKVRQAIFNRLGDRLVGANVLDLFAGTGALGLECLSRGARSVYSIEKSAKHAGYLQGNRQICELNRAGILHQVVVGDVFAVLPRLADHPVKFDLALADPPYGEKNVGRRSTSLAQKLLDDPLLPGFMAAGGLLVLGHTKRDTLELPPIWIEEKVLKHGDTWIRFLRSEPR